VAEVEKLRARVTWFITILTGALVVADMLDDMLLGNRWAGCPKELFPLLGAILAGLYANEALRRIGGARKE
jgi:hypothetical protein